MDRRFVFLRKAAPAALALALWLPAAGAEAQAGTTAYLPLLARTFKIPAGPYATATPPRPTLTPVRSATPAVTPTPWPTRPLPPETPRPTPGPLAPGELIRWVGGYGGAGTAVAVLGDVAYLGIGHQLVVVDLSNPSQARWGFIQDAYQGIVRDLVIAGGRLYVAAGTDGLRILDVADPWSPRSLGGLDTPGDARSIAVEGTLAAVADGPGGLLLVDVADSAAPRALGTLPGGREANGVALRGEVAYAAMSDGNAGALLLVDVSRPASPREAGALITAGQALGVAIWGGIAYVADGFGGLVIADIADPMRARVVRQDMGFTRTVVAADGRLYKAFAFNEVLDGIAVYDLVDPAAPRTINAFGATGFASDITAVGHTFSVADGAGLHVYDGDAASTDVPLIGPIAGLDQPAIHASVVAVWEDRAYLADILTLRVIDLSDRSAPRQIGQVYMEQGQGHPIGALDNRVYFSTGDGKLHVIDASTPSAPRWLPPVALAPEGESVNISGLTIRENQGFVFDRETGMLRALDLTRPGEPKLLGGVSLSDFMGGFVGSVVASGPWLFALGQDSLLAFDVTDPLHLKPAGRLDGLGDAFRLDLSQGLAYVVDADGELHVMDVAVPARMREVGRLQGEQRLLSVTAAGSVVITRNQDGVFELIDVRDPTAPRLLGGLGNAGQGSFGGIWVEGGFAYLPDGSGGLQIYQVANHPLSRPAAEQRRRPCTGDARSGGRG